MRGKESTHQIPTNRLLRQTTIPCTTMAPAALSAPAISRFQEVPRLPQVLRILVSATILLELSALRVGCRTPVHIYTPAPSRTRAQLSRCQIPASASLLEPSEPSQGGGTSSSVIRATPHCRSRRSP